MGIIRKLLAWLSVPIICLFALVFYAARPFNPDNNRILARVVARFGRAVLGMERPLEGWENMLPPRTVTVGKSSLVWVPFFGQVFWLGGNVILNRGRSHKAIAVMKATSSAIARDRKSLWVFPEGTRSRGRGLQKFKKGAFHAAVASGAPITMVCVQEYADEAVGWTGRRESVAIRVLPPIETEGLTVDDIPELIERCHKKMSETIATL